MNKFYRIFFLILLTALQTNAQALFPVSFEKKAAAAALIVEARVVKGQPFWNAAHTMIYTAWDLEVYKVFKGEQPVAPVRLFTQGGVIGDEGVQVSELLRLRAGMEGVFFLYPNTAGIKAPDGNGTLLYDVYASAQGFLHYNVPRNGAYAPFAQYADIEEDLYPALRNLKPADYKELRPLSVVSRTAAKGTGSITNFTPTHVHAGAHLDAANNVLTINGTGFGTASGSAGITFDDADDGGGGNFTALIPYNSSLVTSWSNTQIVVKVPANAGTGDFRIYDNTGTLSATGTGLIVDYAVMTDSFNATDGYQEINMMNTNGTGGYNLAYSTSTAGSGINMLTSSALGAVQRALVTHREIGGMNFKDSTGATINTTTSQAVSSAAPNVITYDNSNTGQTQLPDGVLGVCFTWYGRCGSIGSGIRRTGFDILLYNAAYTGTNNTPFTTGPCAPAETSTSDLDLETVVFHELGHGSNQNHVIDDYQYAGGGYVAVNPASVMHYNLLNGVRRISYDNALLTGVQYARTAKAVTFGSCSGSPFSAMTPLATIISARDECSGLFPATVPMSGRTVAFDLVHSTANKNTDPQYTGIRLPSAGTSVTNTQYYAFKTSAAGGDVTVTINSYTTTPATACASGGVQLALYNVSACPTGQAYPAPVAYRTFTGNGTVSAFTALTGNTSYLLVADGLENTKAMFNAVFTSPTALPVTLLDFNGKAQPMQNILNWSFSRNGLPHKLALERSADGEHFSTVYEDGHVARTDAQYTDTKPLAGANYYRLNFEDEDGRMAYSKTILLVQQVKSRLMLSPVPTTATATLYVDQAVTGPIDAVLYHTSGQECARWQWTAVAGANAFKLDVSAVAAGSYILQVRGGEQVQHLKLMKQ